MQGPATRIATTAGVGVGLIGHTTPATLGLVFAALTFLVKASTGVSVGALSGWLRTRRTVLRWLFRSSRAILVVLGLRLAFEWRQ